MRCLRSILERPLARTICLADGEVTENQTLQAFGSWRVRWRGVPNLGLSPMLQRLSSMWREIEQEPIDAVRLNTGPPQPISLMPQGILDR
jgi:hypothetical protein